MSFRSTVRSALTPPAESGGALAVLRRPTALVLQAVLLLALVAATVVWVTGSKTAQLVVDGQSRTVDFRGSTVADVLSAAHLGAGTHDTLVPAAATKVGDGDKVVLRRGRPLQLVVDGQQRTVWVTATSVDEALTQLDLRQEGLAVSASRSRAIPLSGMALDVRTPKALTITADGHSVPYSTAAATVRDALAADGVTVGAEDRVSPALDTALTPGLVVVVQRVHTEQRTTQLPIAFGTQQKPDASLAKGTTKVLTPGTYGTLRRTTQVTTVDGAVESSKVLSEQTVVAPVAQVVAVGTKAAAPAPAAAPASAPAAAAPASSGGLNWGALAQCESGGNPRAVSPGGDYRGLYQFSLSTWHGVGGSGDPIDASPAEQTNRAQILYSRTGRSSWPVCGKYL